MTQIFCVQEISATIILVTEFTLRNAVDIVLHCLSVTVNR